MIGQVIGNYRIVAELGKGGMGMVYRAEHVQLGRPAALKMLLPQFSNDPAIVQRFFNEARAASAIDHPGIVEIYDFGTHTDGRAYIVMALLKGESLAQRLDRGPMAPLDGAAIVGQVVSVIGAAHARGIVHRDLKPDNIFLVPNELVAGGVQVKLLDFGIAKLADEQGAGLKTQTGALIGTPAYMSPEQCMGSSDLDHRTDLYAVGCILFHLLCGRPPFTSTHGTGVLIAAHLRDAPPDPRTLNPAIPEPLVAITLRLLEKEPAARFQSAADLRAALVAAGVPAMPTLPPSSFPPAAGPGLPSGQRYTGREAFDATSAPTSERTAALAPTTASGSAGQLVAAAPPPPARASRGKAAYWLVGGLVGALAVVGAVVMTRGGDPSPPAAAPAPAAAATPTPSRSAAEVAVTAPAPVPPIEPREAACATGQVRSDDTRGHCCWPAQAWSSTKSACVGVPACPPGYRAARETCVELPATTGVPVAATTQAPDLALDAKRVAPGATVHITFSRPISAPAASRAWIAISEAGSAPSSYTSWKYVDDRAKQVALTAPTATGTYEVRLYTDYPAQAYHVAKTAPLAVAERVEAEVAVAAVAEDGETPVAQQRFALAAAEAPGGTKVTVRFAAALHAKKGEQFWITVVKAGEPDSAWGSYSYVPADARTMQLQLPSAPGEYEIRLHANYPTKSTNLVHRAPIRVVAAS